MHNRSFQDAADEWKANFNAWERGERPEYCSEEHKSLEAWEYFGDPPDRKYYVPWKPEEATWYQVWETVSEGTPVTPPFATNEELIDYLVANGDFWDQQRRADKAAGKHVFMSCGPWTRKMAESLVNGPGWAPSGVVTSSGFMSGVEALADK